RARLAAAQAFGDEVSHEPTTSSRFDISFGADDLSCHVDAWQRPELPGFVETTRSVDESVAMHRSKAEKFCIFKARDHAKHALLFGPSHARLETYEIVRGTSLIFFAQLYNRG